MYLSKYNILLRLILLISFYIFWWLIKKFEVIYVAYSYDLDYISVEQ